MTLNGLPVAVLGAGPVGLAAAAHLIQRGLRPLIFERGDEIGANLNTYRHVRLFSPWQYNIDKAARKLLELSGWRSPAHDGLPTAGELLEAYLTPLAELPEIASALKLGHKVIQVTRQGFDKVKSRGREQAPFVIRVVGPNGERDYHAQAVIDATGTWANPNPLGANGLPALGELGLAAQIAYGMPDVAGIDRTTYAGKRTLVVGAGHSAAGTLLALADIAETVPGTSIVWATRGDQLARVFGGGDADGLPARGQLGLRLKSLRDSGKLELHTNFRMTALHQTTEGIQAVGEAPNGEQVAIDGIDRIVAATGARPDLTLTREMRVRHDPWLESTDALAPLIDPNEHSCGTVRPHGHRELAHPEPGYYAVGAKSYGRAPNFLMATGYEQVRSVVASLVGDMAAADDVQLDLPETGVCNTHFAYDGNAASEPGCCGGPAVDASSACCALDETEKAQGRLGCSTLSSCAPAPKASACCA
ncbi:NAD(P)-binding protein [Pseudoduganella eburnea]|uniref:NAD(P)-binding protein n=2 Tax=Massilia eburnea TaxID=1776165 RepID=A0A6L6QEN0_9BURK|nr:NAD(P)-binding protein [Massilia eburnea]